MARVISDACISCGSCAAQCPILSTRSTQTLASIAALAKLSALLELFPRVEFNNLIESNKKPEAFASGFLCLFLIPDVIDRFRYRSIVCLHYRPYGTAWTTHFLYIKPFILYYSVQELRYWKFASTDISDSGIFSDT